MGDSSKAESWHRRYDLAYSQQEPMFKKFSQWYDIMYTELDDDQFADWRSKVVFPTLGDKTWQLASKFINLKPGFVASAVLPVRDPETPDEEWDQMVNEYREKEEKAQKKLEYDYNNPDLDEPMRDKLLSVMVDALVTGTGLGKVPWTVKKNKRYERMTDPYGQVDMTQEKVYEKIIGHNDLIPVNIMNVFISPSARDLQSASWVIIKEYKTVEELEAINEAYGGKWFDKDALKQLKEGKSQSDPLAQYKSSRNRLVSNQDPIALDTTLKQVAIYECYEKTSNTICTYAEVGGKGKKKESWVGLRESKNFYWHGKYPLVPFYIKKRPHDFWGLGIYQTNHRVNAAKNDIFNHYMDNFNLSVESGLISEEGSVVNDFIVEPGMNVTYSGQKPEQFKFPEPNPAQLTTLLTLLEKEIEGGTISPYAAGSPNSATDTTAGTKGGIMALQEAASDIIGFMRSNFQQSIRMVGQMWHSNNQQFMSAPQTMEVSSQGKDEMTEVSPLDLQGEFDIRIDDASMQPMNKDQLRESFLQFTEQLFGLQTASITQAQSMGSEPIAYDFEALAEDLADQFGQKSIDKYILSPEEVAQLKQEMMMKQQQMQQQQMMGQQQQQEQQMMQQQAKQQEVQGQTTQKADQQVADLTGNLVASGHVDPSQLQ